jgi:hypothetical protein
MVANNYGSCYRLTRIMLLNQIETDSKGQASNSRTIEVDDPTGVSQVLLKGRNSAVEEQETIDCNYMQGKSQEAAPYDCSLIPFPEIVSDCRQLGLGHLHPRIVLVFLEGLLHEEKGE